MKRILLSILIICGTLTATQSPPPDPFHVPETTKVSSSESSMVSPHTILRNMNALQKRTSVGHLSNLTTSFIGTLFTKFWHVAWRFVRNIFIRSIGKDKIYELNEDGSIKTGPSGNRIPRMVEHTILGPHGQPITDTMTNEWFEVVEDADVMLGHIAMAGINKTVSKTLHEAEKLIFRPLINKTLKIPTWKLSYTHYLLAMHERMYPHEAILHPERLTRAIMTTKHKHLLSTSRLPFPLARITGMADQSEKYAALHHGITQHLWTEFKTIWEQKDHGDVSEPSTLEQTATSIKKIGKAALIGKLQEGPLAQVVIATNMALSIPRALAEAFGTGTAPPIKGKETIVHYIDLLDKVSREIRRGTHDSETDITVHIENGTDTTKLTLSPALQKRLLERQESLFHKYEPFLDTTLIGESYEVYLKRLILPQLIYQLLPESVQQKMPPARVARNIKSFGKYFNKTLTALQSLCSLLVMTQTMKDKDSYAGNYVEIADTIDTFMLSMSALLKSWDIPRDQWSKRFKNLMRKTYGENIGMPLMSRLNGNKMNWPWTWIAVGGNKIFTPTQRQQIQRALKKAGIVDQGFVMLDDADVIKAYIRGKMNEADLPGTFGMFSSGPEQLQRARTLQEGRYTSALLNQYNIEKTITLGELKEWVNSYDPENQAEYGVLTEEEISQNATTLILQTLTVLSVEREHQEDLFFTSGTGDAEHEVAEKVARMHREMARKLKPLLSHVRAGLELYADLYGTYGLREVLHGFDAHYRMTGEVLSALTPRMIGKIALTEGLSHVLGIGIEKMLQHLTGQVILQVSRLQGSPLVNSPNLEALVMGHASRFIGTHSSHGIVYSLVRELSRNMIAYGKDVALKPEHLTGAVAGATMGVGASAFNHAQMAYESGKSTPATVQETVQGAGMSPEMFEGLDGFDPFAEGELPVMQSPLSEHGDAVMQEADIILREQQSNEAVIEFLREKLPSLPMHDQEVITENLKKYGFEL